MRVAEGEFFGACRKNFIFKQNEITFPGPVSHGKQHGFKF